MQPNENINKLQTSGIILDQLSNYFLSKHVFKGNVDSNLNEILIRIKSDNFLSNDLNFQRILKSIIECEDCNINDLVQLQKVQCTFRELTKYQVSFVKEQTKDYV